MTKLHHYHPQSVECQTIESGHNIDHFDVLDQSGIIELLVWNIFKQKRQLCLSVLTPYIKKKSLILLQESLDKKDLIDLILTNEKVAHHVPAFTTLKGTHTGVMTISPVEPQSVYSFKMNEPFLRLPKSALVSFYALSSQELLLVVNIHAINFSLGTKKYDEQMQNIGEKIRTHTGPMIIAGDFNAWSRKRLYLLYRFIHKMNLKPVHFPSDQRKQFLGLSLDFIFYRGLHVDYAYNLPTEASDHNPMCVRFQLIQSHEEQSTDG